MKNINLYVDGADLTQMTRLAQDPRAKGFTTNPSLMHKAGITDYEYFAHKVLPIVAGRPVSFEVFADDFTSMERQAHVISAWGKNVFVKIPIMNTRAESSLPLIAALSRAGVSLNVTAIMTLDQVFGVLDAVDSSAKTIVSVFAGRIADTGRDPIPMMTQAAKAISRLANVELLWASVRELLNVFHAEQSGCCAKLPSRSAAP